jgi:hypothetical protein
MRSPSELHVLDATLNQLQVDLDAREVHALFLGALSSTTEALPMGALIETVVGETKLEDAEEVSLLAQVLGDYWNTLEQSLEGRAATFVPRETVVGVTREAGRDLVLALGDELHWFFVGLHLCQDSFADFSDIACRAVDSLSQVADDMDVLAESLLKGEEPTGDPEELRQWVQLLLEKRTLCEGLVGALIEFAALYRKRVMAERAVLRYVGRNDPCPCGSGKKYKKCCLGGPIQWPSGDAPLQ